MFSKDMTIASYDPELASAIAAEVQRQEDHIDPRVMEAQGSVLTNKYAEGYPSKRYYGGCEYVDVAEQLAIDRVKELFGADYANGSSANLAVYMALLEPGDTVLGMSLAHGGHLTHGSHVYNAVQYGIDDNGVIDYEEVAALAREHKPKMVIAGFSAYSQVIDWQKFRDIADEVGAYLFVDMAHVAGLVAAGVYPSPVQIADVTTSTTHKTLRGPRGGIILAKANEEIEKKLNSLVFPGTQGGPLMHAIAGKAVAFKEALEPEFTEYQKQVVVNAQAMANTFMERGFNIVSGVADAALGNAHITVNKNSVPNDPQSPFVTSGLRIGSPAITTRGFNAEDSSQLAHWICDVLESIAKDENDTSVIEEVTKSGGEKQAFNEHKLRAGLMRATQKRPVDSKSIDRACDGNSKTYSCPRRLL
ncbi:Serine hydroxymethyltransferase [Nymphon striatum]|nr:Serine hydroxymethyltransferase [Nymphon striatum]